MAPMRNPAPADFTSKDYAARMARVVRDALNSGLDGVLVAPGPDLVWLTGYQPTAITERLTVLVLCAGREPVLLVPALERPDAEAAPGAAGVSIADWADGADPYEAASALLRPDGRFGISDSAWAMHLLGLHPRRVTNPGSSTGRIGKRTVLSRGGDCRQRPGAAADRRG